MNVTITPLDVMAVIMKRRESAGVTKMNTLAIAYVPEIVSMTGTHNNHTPGTAWGCNACHTQCHCADVGLCVSCELERDPTAMYADSDLESR